MKRFLKVLLALFAVLAVILLVQTFRVKSHQINVTPIEKIPLDQTALLKRLSGALQIQTVSYDDPSRLNRTEFGRFHVYLSESFPLVYTRLSYEKVNEFSLLFRWPGKDPTLAPIVLMAHLDVVPVEQTKWKHPPFGGISSAGYLWGRGALDDKSSLIAQLEAVELMLQKNFQPEQTLYFAFGHDEEAGGEAAAAIAKLLESRGIHPRMVIDEGGAILEEFIPGLAVPTAMIGTSEKGYLTLLLNVRDEGGHSSAPPNSTAVGRMSRAIQRLEHHPMSARLEGSTSELIDFLAPEMPFLPRLVLANRWLFQPLIVSALSKVRFANAAVRTTTAVTMIDGGVKENVLPASVTATVNFRIRPGETMEDVIEHVRNTIEDDAITITKRPQGINPSPVSSSHSPEFQLLQRTIRQVYPDVIVVPGMVIGATDARYYSRISKNVFRFAPFRVGTEDFRGVHGTDERIAVDGYLNMIRFYVHLIGQL